MIWGINALAGPNVHTMSVWAIGFCAIAFGSMICVGFLTPAASAAVTVGYLITGLAPSLMTHATNHSSTSAAFSMAGISAALVLLGPGAFSLDARLFGRREIIIPERPAHLLDDSRDISEPH